MSIGIWLCTMGTQIEVPTIEGDDSLTAGSVLAVFGEMILRIRHRAGLLASLAKNGMYRF